MNVHHEITAKINNRGRETNFADKFMECLRKDFRGEGPARRAEICTKLQFMKRQSYATTEEYINDMQYWHSLGENLDLGFPPYFSMINILRELSGTSHLESFMHVKRTEFYAREKGKSNVVKSYNMDSFYKDCIELLADIRPIEENNGFSGSAAVAAQTNKSRQTPISHPLDKTTDMKNAPPKGVKPEEWVNSWLNGPSKKDGGCAF
jgi:hypothetical protein